MRNLRNVGCSQLESPGRRVTASAWDVATNSVILALGPTKDDSLLQVKRWLNPRASADLTNSSVEELQYVASWDAPSPLPALEYDKVLSLRVFSESLTICLVLAGGDIVVVREQPLANEEKIEIVGSVDAGISAAAWSPDEELLAITTCAGTLLYMTRDFENVTDITFTSDDLKASKHVSVGWGKSETQFKGKGAKVLRDPTIPEQVDEGVLSRLDNQRTTITWRGDGAFLAVNSIEPKIRRVIRVYSREGVLDSVSEPVDGLDGSLCWRPAGNLIAGIQHLNDRVQVIFFERNGLRHGKFDLRLTKEEIYTWGQGIELKWNIDSSVLAVCFGDRVHLWTMSNYHYFLKQEIVLMPPGSDAESPYLSWHPEKPLCFVICSEAGLQRLDYTSVIVASPTSPPQDYGVMAVIDGKLIKLTALRIANIPPPMASYELVIESNAIDVAVTAAAPETALSRIAVLHGGGLNYYEWDLQAKPPKAPSLVSSFEFPSHENSLKQMKLQISFESEQHLLVLQSDLEGTSLISLSLVEYYIKFNKRYNIRGVRSLISSIASNSKNHVRSCFLLTNTYDILQGPSPSTSAVEASPIQEKPQAHLPLFAPSAAIYDHVITKAPRDGASLPGHTNPEFNPLAFGLSDNGSLYADHRLLARNCTSFLVTPAHLIFTTTQHILKFVHMTNDAENLELPPDTPETDERCRSIERGARLVTVMPSIFALVLQMPRGNLETIYPRALVLAGIRKSLNEKMYRKALLACRNHRVDMNILHDHAPTEFINDVTLFVEQVKKVEHIDLFLSQLREEDVSRSMYRETLRPDLVEVEPSNPRPGSKLQAEGKISKVNRICDAILGVLRKRPATNLQNVITAHLCKSPPHLEAGLSEISGLKKGSPDQVQKAIEHICFLADVNRLYDTALGLYDLETALLIAQQSQKDPREYIPFLQNLQQMSLLRRQFTIEDHLGRWERALQHLFGLGDFDEAKMYVQRHSLYSHALEFYRYQKSSLQTILRLYAQYLEQESKHKEAAIVYENLGEYVLASDMYRLAHLWKESLVCATLVPLPHADVHNLARDLAGLLVESKDYFSAAIVYLDYLADVETAARLFCRGYFFTDALRIVGLHQRSDLLEPIIDAGLVEGMTAITELLAECKGQLNAQVPRIHELRTKKAEDPLAFFGGDDNAGADIPDNVSVAPTDTSTAAGGTLFTRYTNQTGTVGTGATRKTSKNRKREERKRARGKKGSVYEEEYLINSVARLVERVNLIGDEVVRLVAGLVRRGMRELAGAVEVAMADVVEMCRRSTQQIFLSGEQHSATAEPIQREEIERPQGGNGVLWESIEEGRGQREAPIVKDFERLSWLTC